MSNHVTISGNLGNDPELRFTPSGKPVVNGSIGDTPRRLNKDTGKWEDAGETLWLRFSLWNNAEAFTEAARKGSKVVATGRLKSRSWDDKESGQKRTVTELDADSVAIVPKSSAGTSNWQQNQAPQQGGFGGQQQADPWAQQGQQSQQQANGFSEPPF